MKNIVNVPVDRIKEIIERTISWADRYKIAHDMRMESVRSPHGGSHLMRMEDILPPVPEYFDLENYLKSLSRTELRILTHAMIEGRYIREGYSTVCPMKDLETESEREVPMYSHTDDVGYVAGKLPLAEYLRTYLRVEAAQATKA